jgi:hypothetical protein
MEKIIMATEKQIAANNKNAQLSTGPRTKQGKAIASQNSLKHGLRAKTNVIHTESKAEFEFHRDQMLIDYKPVGPMESILVERIIILTWRLRRSTHVHTATINTMNKDNASTPLTELAKSFLAKSMKHPTPASPHVSKADLNLGRLIIKDFSNGRVLDRLQMNERRIESSLSRTMLQFYQLKLIHQMNPPDLPAEQTTL